MENRLVKNFSQIIELWKSANWKAQYLKKKQFTPSIIRNVNNMLKSASLVLKKE